MEVLYLVSAILGAMMAVASFLLLVSVILERNGAILFENIWKIGGALAGANAIITYFVEHQIVNGLVWALSPLLIFVSISLRIKPTTNLSNFP